METPREGQTAPAFTLTAQDGRPVSLAGYRGKFVVLFFFVKANTSGWISEASEFRDAYQKFQVLNAEILACSADVPEVMAKFAAKHHIPFLLLSDPDFQAIELYGARRMKLFLGKSFLGIVRSTFLIDPQGIIAQVWPAARAKGHAEEVLEILGKR